MKSRNFSGFLFFVTKPPPYVGFVTFYRWKISLSAAASYSLTLKFDFCPYTKRARAPPRGLRASWVLLPRAPPLETDGQRQGVGIRATGASGVLGLANLIHSLIPCVTYRDRRRRDACLSRLMTLWNLSRYVPESGYKFSLSQGEPR